MNEHESFQPEVNPSDRATIEDIMSVRGISFAEARRQWEAIKAKINQEVLENKEKDNG